jgi:hypothetical protein
MFDNEETKNVCEAIMKPKLKTGFGDACLTTLTQKVTPSRSMASTRLCKRKRQLTELEFCKLKITNFLTDQRTIKKYSGISFDGK